MMFKCRHTPQARTKGVTNKYYFCDYSEHFANWVPTLTLMPKN